MKKSRIILSAVAFMFAVVAAFASATVQDAWFDSNGLTSGGGQTGTISNPPVSGSCTTSGTSTICVIGSNYAFDTQAHAETDAGRNLDNSVGLLKQP